MRYERYEVRLLCDRNETTGHERTGVGARRLATPVRFHSWEYHVPPGLDGRPATLRASFYRRAQIESLLAHVDAMDDFLLEEGTYYVVELEGTIVTSGDREPAQARYRPYPPTISRTISSWLLCSGRRSPAANPRRSTRMRSATAKMSTRL